MKIVKLVTVVSAMFLISACEVSLPRIKIPGVIVIDGGHGHGHCPPGQAKKGNC